MRHLLSLLKNFDSRTLAETLLAVRSPFETLHAVFSKISFSQHYVSLNQHFQRIRNGYIVSAPAFSSVLGDIFMSMVVKSAVRTSTPFEKLRIVFTLKPPIAIQRQDVHQDDSRQLPAHFYIQLRGLYLHGCCYDAREESICDSSESSEQGCHTPLELYAWVVTDEKYFAVIPERYVSVPMLVGGCVRPDVPLANKT